MKYLKIENKGELDIRIIALMGGTTKADDSYKIGNFGTGLKYTIAYLFRNNISFEIFSGLNQIKMGIEKETIQGNEFSIICIGGHRTSITTQMGNDWEAWMIVREIYSNALDEGDSSYSITDKVDGTDGKTCFYIELTPEIMEVYNNWDEYFIVGKESFYESKNLKLYPQSGNLKIYKQGILINEVRDKPSLFNYDIGNADINELREYRGSLEYDLCTAIMSINDKKVIQYLIENIDEKDYEAEIDYNFWHMRFSEEWQTTLDGAKIIDKKSKEQLEARGIEVDEAENIVVPQRLYKGLTMQFEGIGALRVSKAVNDFYEIYDEKLHDKVKKAQSMLEDAGYWIDPELSFIYGVFGSKNILAKVCLDSKKIYISEKHMDQDLFSIMTMLVEENEHYKTGLTDHTREFQQHFINLYTNAMIEKAKVDVL